MRSQEAGIIINEVSNGASGIKEWVELLVIGDPANPTSPVDLTNWIIDDNNGDFQSLSTGVGISTGHIILGSIFDDVLPGSLIVIYNSNDPDVGELPADDVFDINDDHVYVVSIDAVSLKNSGTKPTNANAAYTPCIQSSTTVTSWGRISLRNSGDAFQVRKPDGSFFHGFSYEDIDANTLAPTFPISNNPSFNVGAGGSGSTFSFACGDWENSANFTRSGLEGRTAGLANSSANQIVIEKIRNGTFDYANLGNPINCTQLTLDTKSNPTSCSAKDGIIRLEGLVANTSYTLNYLDDGIMIRETILSNASGVLAVSNLDAGSYGDFYVTFDNINSNVITGPILLVNPSSVIPEILSNDLDNNICQGDSVTFTATGGDEYEFFKGSLSVQGQSPNATYTTTDLADGDAVSVIVTDTATGCSSTSTSIVMQVQSLPIVDSSADVSRCDFYVLPALTSGSYYTETNGGGQALFQGDRITSTQTIFIYEENSSIPNCSSENSFTVTITNVPIINITQAPTCTTQSNTYSVEVTVSQGVVTSTAGVVTNITGSVWSISEINLGEDIDITVTSAASNCQQSLRITSPICVVAQDDYITLNGGTGETSQNLVNANDTLNGNAAILGTNVSVTSFIDTNPTDGISFDPLTGEVKVAPNTEAGEHLIEYEICSSVNPVYCNNARIFITVNNIANLALSKTGFYIDTNGDNLVTIGDQIEYTFSVQNNGEVPVFNIVVLDSLPNIELIGDPIDLMPGEINSSNFKGFYTLTQNDIIEGQVVNQAIAEGQIANGYNVNDLSDDPLDTTDVDFDDDNDFEDQTIVFLLQPDEVFLYQAMSPNGDNINDALRIPGLHAFPNNVLQIYNRWGIIVFSEKGYEQPGKELFTGNSNKGLRTFGTTALPTGTYYYSLEYVAANELLKRKTGYFYINR
ncbi:gliding motility-associated C-terminal domain-containing protein [Aquimarina sp. W85]|uniref:T9SS type B sorting domain-containing protein n=1 Tax=Aquimarina rhodophyticola TaxID=3342246 RepID=UPI003671A49A